jgi:hypothetical protein
VTAEVRAWARERIAETLSVADGGNDITYFGLADAVLAVLPELLTDERVVEAAAHGGHSGRLAYTRRALIRAGELLAGAS